MSQNADSGWSEMPARCANLECPNEAHEGRMTLLRTGKQAVGGHRGITLYLCGPCARALQQIDGSDA